MTEHDNAPARRRLLLGGAAAAGAVLLTPAAPAEAANGRPLLLGRDNSASAPTDLIANVAGSAASITNTATDEGIAIRAFNGPGRASDLDGLPHATRAAIEAAGHAGVVGVGRTSTGVTGVAVGEATYGVYAKGFHGLGATGRHTGIEVDGDTFAIHTRGPLHEDGCAVLVETNDPDHAAIYATGSIRTLGKAGHAGSGFVIDHPQLPENTTLSHSVVESDARKNIYDGIATAGSDGYVVVNLPVWFEALNTDIRYQLTPLGGPAPNLHVYRTVQQGSFVIGGAQPDQQISWQLTGVRKDLWARLHPLVVERPKGSPPWWDPVLPASGQAREPQE